MTELATIARDPAVLDTLGDSGAFIVQACERAKAWLAEALEHGEIDQIVELKSQAEAIRIYTTSKQLGKDAELSAAEIVRRAERGIGIAIRRGQEAGKIAKPGDIGGRPTRGTRGAHPGDARGHHLDRPSSFLPKNELASGIYPVTDGVTDDQFDAAVEEAKVEGNLSRANVVRKLQGEPAKKPDTTPPGRKRRPITDTAREAGWELRKNIEKIERIISDDRFTENKKQVTAHLHSHLLYAVETLSRLLDTLPTKENNND